MTLQGAWWTWATILVTRYHKTEPTFDWVDSGFGAGFGVFIFLTLGFQLNYLFLYVAKREPTSFELQLTKL